MYDLLSNLEAAAVADFGAKVTRVDKMALSMDTLTR